MRSLYFKELFIKWLTATSVCFGTGASLTNLHYTIKDNGVMVSLDYTEPINSDDIIIWKSDRQWIYISLFGVRAPKNKIPLKKLEWPVKKIVLDEFNESTQLAILIGKPILGYDILDSKTSSGTVVFIHTKLKDSEIANLKRHINKNGKPVYDLVQSSDSQEDTTSFEITFNEARLELGSNSIFKYKEKLYTTNHSDEDSSKINLGLMSAELLTGAENEPERIYANSPTDETFNEKMGTADLVMEDQLVQNDSHFYSYDNNSQQPYDSYEQEDSGRFKRLFRKITNHIKQHQKIKKSSPDHDGNRYKDFYLRPGERSQYYSYAYEKPLPIYPEWIEINEIKAGIFPATYQKQYNPLIEIEQIVNESEPYAISSNWIDIKRDEIGFDREYINPATNYSGQVNVSKYFPKGIPNDTLAQLKWDRIEPREMSLVSEGISITSNIDGVLIYIDRILVGETPLSEPIDISPGWHQVYGLTPSFAKTVNEVSTENLYDNHTIWNNQKFGSQAVYVDPGDVSIVNFKFEKIGNGKKYLNKTKGDIIIGLPVIMALFGIMTWGLM